MAFSWCQTHPNNSLLPPQITKVYQIASGLTARPKKTRHFSHPKSLKWNKQRPDCRPDPQKHVTVATSSHYSVVSSARIDGRALKTAAAAKRRARRALTQAKSRMRAPRYLARKRPLGALETSQTVNARTTDFARTVRNF